MSEAERDDQAGRPGTTRDGPRPDPRRGKPFPLPVAMPSATVRHDILQTFSGPVRRCGRLR